MPPPKVHITGASGAGVTTLGHALAKRLGAVQLDTDDFYWLPVEPRYSAKREPAERLALIRKTMTEAGVRGFILSGSIGTWGDPLIPCFHHVIFVTTPTELRLERLKRRETEMFGAESLAPGGPRHEEFVDFINWAGDYDSGLNAGRSRPFHEAWLRELTCPILRLTGSDPIEDLVERSILWLDA